MGKRTIIIGGVAGGATTATRLRRRDESMEIIMFEKGENISYANCGLPYYIGDVIKGRDALLLQTPKAMMAKFNIDIRVLTEVIKIDPDSKKIQAKNLTSNEIYEESYDYLVIATGSSPIKPRINGIESEHIFTLWNVNDTDAIKSYIEKKKPKRAAVIGGGFIGIEMAENLHGLGLDVSLIEMQDQVMTTFDYEMAQLLHENMRMNHVNLILSDGVKEFKSNGEATTIMLTSGKSLTADLIILSIGVKPNSNLAKECGLELNSRGGIVVDSNLRTSNKDIFAVGDVIEVDHFILKDKTMIPLAGPANKQARICADNIAGDKKEYRGSLGTAVAKVFDYTAASVGVNEKTLKSKGKVKHKDYETVLIQQKSHAGYYPGATPLMLKLIFDFSGLILGGQIIGQDSVDKRMDTIATTIKLGGSIYDLAELELAYAPPFSSAKDPVNMLGFVAENVINGFASFIEWNELDEILGSDDLMKNHTILDVTEEMERMVCSIPDSYHIPLGQLHSRISELKKDSNIIVYCSIGVRSYNAARVLMQHGYQNVKILSGGLSFYKSMHHEYDNNQENDNNLEHDFSNSEENMAKDSMVGEKSTHSGNTPKSNGENIDISREVKVLDCCGLQCPGPIMKVNQTIADMKEGELLKVTATDMGFAKDIETWCRRTGNTFIKKERINNENVVVIRKGLGDIEILETKATVGELPQGKTLIVFSGDLDKVLASFIIANGAASMGRPVTMFFTFWGLNALRKSEKISVNKSIIEKMFGFMMPRGSKKLKLSKMHMAGMGTKMMRMVMKDKNVDSLEDLMKQAMANGVKIVACTMSMDVMGIKKEELIDGIDYAGVATYLGDAEESNVNLFV